MRVHVAADQRRRPRADARLGDRCGRRVAAAADRPRGRGSCSSTGRGRRVRRRAVGPARRRWCAEHGADGAPRGDRARPRGAARRAWAGWRRAGGLSTSLPIWFTGRPRGPLVTTSGARAASRAEERTHARKAVCVARSPGEATSPLEVLHHCHCSRCRKQHGAPFSTFGRFRRDGFRYTRGDDRLKSFPVVGAHRAHVLRRLRLDLEFASTSCGRRLDGGRELRRGDRGQARRAHLRDLEGVVVRHHRRPAVVRGLRAAPLTSKILCGRHRRGFGAASSCGKCGAWLARAPSSSASSAAQQSAKWLGAARSAAPGDGRRDDSHGAPPAARAAGGAARTSVAIAAQRAAKPIPLKTVTPQSHARIGTGLEELDRVLGGGIVPGSVTRCSAARPLASASRRSGFRCSPSSQGRDHRFTSAARVAWSR